MRYRAFLSYSHADAAWARWLLRRLESYRVPARLVGTPGVDGPIPVRLGAMFRDRDELPSAGDLSATIRDALEQSATLVVLCSPAAAQSQWVNAEVAAFRGSGRGARVLCFIVDGDPGSRDRLHDCFPPALWQPDADGVQREPLAADARAAGDGRDRAFLKLVAGLLGVGYDTLAQRETQRRNRKLAVVAAASLAGMAVALALAASAWVARNDAQRRQAQAEDILGFMLGDLRQKLSTVGRLDLMRAVDSKATRYFATLDPRDLSDRALEEQARSLTGIGQVRLEETDHAAAMNAFREAHARSTALRARQPDNGQRLFDLAQAEYWIGYVAWKQGRLDDAEAWLRRYRDSAITLAAMDRANFDWQKEVAYGHHNLAVMDEGRGLHARAEQAMRAELALFRAWVRQRPDDTALQFEASTVVSWLGSSSAKQGKLRDAAALFSEQVRGLERLRMAEPANVRWREELISALVQRAGVQAQRGRLDDARRDVDAAAEQAAALVRQDPDNRKWRVARGITLGWQAQLDAANRPEMAEAHARAAQALFVGVKPVETRDVLALRWLARTNLFLARLALARNDLAVAHGQLRDADAVLGASGVASDDESIRVLRADALALAGEAAQRAGDDAAADRAWRQARELLLAKTSGALPFTRLDPLVRVLRHLGQDDQARPYRQRLASSGFVPLTPWPATTAVATR